jgi:hypothetical protein
MRLVWAVCQCGRELSEYVIPHSCFRACISSSVDLVSSCNYQRCFSANAESARSGSNDEGTRHNISTLQLHNTYRTPLTLQAIISVGYSYPISITASRLSLLFLLRRIFRMQVLWFRIGWWAISSLVVAWLIMSLAFGSLHLAGRVSLEFEFDYAIPAVTFTNAIIDLFVLVLPLGMTYGLQMPMKQKAAVIGIFALGSVYVILFFIPIYSPNRCMIDRNRTYYTIQDHANTPVPKRHSNLPRPRRPQHPIQAKTLGPALPTLL